MPIYEYRCETCGKEFELFRSITETETPVCRFCGGSVKKLISLSSFHLKGTGWYVTDYARKGSPEKREGKEGSTESSSGEKSGTTSKSSSEKEGN